METRTKVVGGAVLLAGLYAWLKPKMIIKVLKTDAAAKSVQYYMKYYGAEITDTFVLGDGPNIIPVGDGKHLFVASGNTTTGIVELDIGYEEQGGGFKALKGEVISF